MGRRYNPRISWMVTGIALCVLPAAPAQNLPPGQAKVYFGFRVTPLTSAITGTDPDVPLTTGQLVQVDWTKLKRVNSWSLKVRAILANCGNFDISALTVRCLSATPVTEGARCDAPIPLSTEYQEIAGGGVAQPNKFYSVVAAYELRDSWRFHALSGCSITLNYQASSQ